MQNRLDNDEQTVTKWWHTTPPAPQMTLLPVQDVLNLYLADVRRTLAGVSEVEAQAIIAEIRQHVLASAQGYEELGDAPEAALQHALAAFGAPQELGQSFSTTYQTTGAARSLPPWVAMRRALRVVVPAHALTMSLWLLLTLLLIGHSVPLVLSGGFTFALLLAIPLIVGWRIGAATNTPRAGFGTFLALALLALVSSPLLVIYLHLPSGYYTELLSLFPLLFVAWMPTACVSASAANFVSQQRTKRMRLAR